MLVERPRERVGAVVLADEIQVVHGGRTGGGFERRLAGRGDRARRQPGIAVGVVRRIELQIVPPQVAVVFARLAAARRSPWGRPASACRSSCGSGRPPPPAAVPPATAVSFSTSDASVTASRTLSPCFAIASRRSGVSAFSKSADHLRVTSSAAGVVAAERVGLGERDSPRDRAPRDRERESQRRVARGLLEVGGAAPAWRLRTPSPSQRW